MTYRTRSILLVGLVSLFAFVRPAFADDTPVVIRGVDVDGYPNVAVNVSVASSTLPEDIRVTENGSPVSILTIRPLIESGQEIDVVLAIDTSRSIRGAPLQAAIAAAKTFMGGLPEGVQVGVLTFSGQVRILLPITSDHAAVLNTLDSIDSTESGTTLYDAVEAAAAMFSGHAQHNILLLTDGRDSGSRNDLPTAIAAAQHAHAAAFTRHWWRHRGH